MLKNEITVNLYISTADVVGLNETGAIYHKLQAAPALSRCHFDKRKYVLQYPNKYRKTYPVLIMLFAASAYRIALEYLIEEVNYLPDKSCKA